MYALAGCHTSKIITLKHFDTYISTNNYIFISFRIHRSAGPAALVLELVHKTLLEEIPYAMCAFQGKVLIGVKNLVRLYDLGKKKLLRKSENKVS